MNIPVVCALDDEDVWLEDMDPVLLEKIWNLIETKGQEVDAFVPVSNYYRDKILSKIHIADEKLHTIHIGIDLDGYGEDARILPDPPVIGYLSRMQEALGLGILVDAFIKLKAEPGFEDLCLKVTGGETGDDRKFVKKLKNKLNKNGMLDDVEFVSAFDRMNRIRFMESISVMSVPMQVDEAYGLFQLEAMAAGVPLVQPERGAFPEIIEMTGGGVLYSPNQPEELARVLSDLLSDRTRLTQTGKQGRESVQRLFTSDLMAEKLIELYNSLITNQNS